MSDARSFTAPLAGHCTARYTSLSIYRKDLNAS